MFDEFRYARGAHPELAQLVEADRNQAECDRSDLEVEVEALKAEIEVLKK